MSRADERADDQTLCSPGAALRETDPEIAALIDEEIHRQNDGLELIASENFVSPAVLEAMGSPLTNKYAEGLPGKRYYGGCEVVDQVEQLAIDRAKQLFGAEHANVQPHSGAQANYAAMSPFLKPGDTFLGMDLSNGGHLTHGSPVNFSGMLYQGDLVRRHRRRAASTTTTCVARRASIGRSWCSPATARTRAWSTSPRSPRSRRRSARSSWSTWRTSPGSSPAGVYPSPVPHADVVTTTTHKTLRGPRGGLILCKAEHAKAIDKSVFPGKSGRSARARHRREGRVLQGSARSVVQGVRTAASSPTRARLPRRWSSRGFQIVSGGTDNHLMLVDLRNRGAHRKGRAAGARRGGDHRQQEHRAEGDAVAVRDERNSHRHVGGDDARHGRGRDGADRRADRSRACAPDDASVKAAVREEVRALARAFPLYSCPVNLAPADAQIVTGTGSRRTTDATHCSARSRVV